MDLDDEELKVTRRMNGSDKNAVCIEEDIKNIEEIIELSKEEIDAKDENITAILDLEDLLSLRNLIKAYKELEEENIQLEAIKEEKIEELKEDIKKGKTRYPYILEHKIEVLQELLEKRK